MAALKKREGAPRKRVRVYIQPSVIDLTWQTTVRAILDGKEGWRQFLDIAFVSDPETAQVVMRLASQKEMDMRFGNTWEKLRGLSVTDSRARDKATVWIHGQRWMHGPDAKVRVRDATGRVVTSPKQALRCYRTYVVNHEFGHALGLPHPPVLPDSTAKPREFCSVMHQQTRTTHGGLFQALPMLGDFQALQRRGWARFL